ncbi:MAG: hypothetical protein ACW967_04210 [Candidatus Hodarchaeales archaeon]|jgi:GTPase SAR1 family protein
MVFLIKIVIVGDKQVGKNQMLKDYPSHFSKAYFSQGFQPHFIEKKINDIDVRFQIWILNPREHYQPVRKPHYLGLMGSIVVVDVKQRESVLNTLNWIKEIWKNSDKDEPIVIIGNTTSTIKNKSVLDKNVTAKVLVFQLIKSLINKENNPNLIIKYIENNIDDNQGFEFALNFLGTEYLKKIRSHSEK